MGVSSNFTPHENQRSEPFYTRKQLCSRTILNRAYWKYPLLNCRHASRYLLIEFQEPPIRMKTSQHMRLVELWDQCSSCVGFCIGLGAKFFSVGYEEIDDVLVPLLESKADSSVAPRVFPSYAILVWFADKVCYVRISEGNLDCLL